MKLIIGGMAQGKLEYVLEKYHLTTDVVWDGCIPMGTDGKEQKEGYIVINHFHLWARRRMALRERPEEEIMTFLDSNEDCIIICDEIGNGIVPVDSFEREYRECVGRILVRLAKRAEEVERVICGIGQKIK